MTTISEVPGAEAQNLAGTTSIDQTAGLTTTQAAALTTTQISAATTLQAALADTAVVAAPAAAPSAPHSELVVLATKLASLEQEVVDLVENKVRFIAAYIEGKRASIEAEAEAAFVAAKNDKHAAIAKIESEASNIWSGLTGAFAVLKSKL